MLLVLYEFDAYTRLSPALSRIPSGFCQFPIVLHRFKFFFHYFFHFRAMGLYCFHPVAILLPLKCLTDNDVTDVATFETMSACKPNLKSLNINMVVGVFNGFLIKSVFRQTRPSQAAFGLFPTKLVSRSK
jgi:hypothetical protein